ncbi:hypothetical protein PENANT_c013G00607 [Penicillium antarcticum]|uniref:C2H2-type domain-containing protein n=1 Tax=Penicillium antarcticum TaxID=416450 RepID=A0A1V6Q6J1_9EURO|nr:uncharacterized protein N7508_004155 [Penicillium antarcticum]KAJ5308776.1 hypothetical protein N7508_004155 [Penicillium antarcticum]OQD84406.1 hypothetical protein PENANT_c013G00607 [Penicillium antarcticum]
MLFHISLLAITCLTLTHTLAMTTPRYKGPLPEFLPILKNYDEAREFQIANLDACMWPENGGHYFKDMDNKLLAVASDELCEYVDRGNAEIDAMIAAGELPEPEECDVCEGKIPCRKCFEAASKQHLENDHKEL